MRTERRPRTGSRTAPPLAAAAAWLLAAGAAAAADPGRCGPFPAEASRGADAAEVCRESGVLPSATGADAAAAAIGHLAAADAAEQPTAIPGEALVALPRRADGSIASDLELAPGARLVDSFFSPVLCATVARIAADEDADAGAPSDPAGSAASLVTHLPEGAALVPHHRYIAAQAVLRAFEDTAAAHTRDPYREHQYALDQLEAERAWPVSDGRGAVVAVLDSAPARTHPELVRVELVGLAGAAPGGGTPGDGAPGGGAPRAAVHGTLMAGVLASVPDNGIGIAGVAPGAHVVAVPVCRPAGDGAPDRCALFDVLRGIDRAWQADARIVNLSLVGPSNPLLERAVARLERLGRVVVAAAGNEGRRVPRYPAAYPSVIGVGAVDRDGARYARSNTGFAVELFAPGVEILSTRPPDGYAFGDGTSLAAAHVSGALAVLIGAGVDPAAARAAIAADAGAAAAPGAPAARLRSLCAALAAAGHPCAAAARTAPGGR